MIFSYFKILLISLVLTLAKSNVAPYSFTCSPTLPHLSVGDYNLTESNFERTIAKHNIVAIIITATWYKGSCMYEPFWKDLKDNVLEKSNVKMARIDFTSNNNRWISEYFKVERIPMLVFAKNKMYYPYDSLLDTVRIQNYLDKMEKPIMNLATLEEVEEFFRRENYDSRGALIYSVKVVGIFYNLEEMEEELKDFRNTAEKSVERPEIYFATLLNPAEIKKARQKYQDEWFEDYSLSTIVIQKVAGSYNKIELSEIYFRSVQETIKLNTFPLVQEYNLQNHYEYEKTKLPMLVGVVDSANDPNHFRDFILTLEKVASNYTDKVHFTWVDGIFNKNKKQMLGIEHDNLPTLAFNLILDPKNNTLSYPQEWPLTPEKISRFVNDYITYSLEDLSIIYGKVKKVEKSSIYNIFTHVREYGSNNFTSSLSKRKKTDFVLIIFDSQRHKNMYTTAQSFNHIAKRFQALQVRKLEFGVYDTFYFDLPDNFRSLNVPCFAMITANQRQKPFYIPLDIDVQDFMKLIHERASFEFYLPEYPHIPEEQLEQFYTELIEKGSTPDFKSFFN